MFDFPWSTRTRFGASGKGERSADELQKFDDGKSSYIYFNSLNSFQTASTSSVISESTCFQSRTIIFKDSIYHVTQNHAMGPKLPTSSSCPHGFLPSYVVLFCHSCLLESSILYILVIAFLALLCPGANPPGPLSPGLGSKPE